MKVYASKDYVDEKIDVNKTIIDPTLSVFGQAADAKAVSDALTQKSQVQIVIWEADD